MALRTARISSRFLCALLAAGLPVLCLPASLGCRTEPVPVPDPTAVSEPPSAGSAPIRAVALEPLPSDVLLWVGAGRPDRAMDALGSWLDAAGQGDIGALRSRALEWLNLGALEELLDLARPAQVVWLWDGTGERTLAVLVSPADREPGSRALLEKALAEDWQGTATAGVLRTAWSYGPDWHLLLLDRAVAVVSGQAGVARHRASIERLAASSVPEGMTAVLSPTSLGRGDGADMVELAKSTARLLEGFGVRDLDLVRRVAVAFTAMLVTQVKEVRFGLDLSGALRIGVDVLAREGTALAEVLGDPGPLPLDLLRRIPNGAAAVVALNVTDRGRSLGREVLAGSPAGAAARLLEVMAEGVLSYHAEAGGATVLFQARTATPERVVALLTDAAGPPETVALAGVQVRVFPVEGGDSGVHVLERGGATIAASGAAPRELVAACASGAQAGSRALAAIEEATTGTAFVWLSPVELLRGSSGGDDRLARDLAGIEPGAGVAILASAERDRIRLVATLPADTMRGLRPAVRAEMAAAGRDVRGASLGQLEALRDAVCLCRDRACAEGLKADLTTTLALAAALPLEPADRERLGAVTTDIERCVRRAMTM